MRRFTCGHPSTRAETDRFLGVIVGSGYHVNPKSLGYRTCTYVGIKLEKGIYV